MENFKKDYDKIMIKIAQFHNKHSQKHKDILQYVVALGHLVRTTYEMDPGQLAYVLELRTTPQSHQSYRRLMQELYRIVKKKAPLFAKYIRVNLDQNASRKQELERKK
ncbi:MAG: FAD-dependent thymidylate synthase [bacterium]|nr:FAD-dependent thymidylate synthase [bacterium]